MRLLMRLLVVVVLLGSTGATSASAATGPASGCATAILATSATGGGAITAAGSHLADVAAINSVAVDVLRQRLASDATLGVDPCGRLFYVDAGTAVGGASTAPATASTLPFPSGDTFLLHSRPGASRVIFLDFDGETLTSTAWNSYFTLASPYFVTGYDTDGSPSTFSDAERGIVQDVWQRVAEDYAPFDVDVTTEDPGVAAIDRSGSGDTVYGTRALITNDAGMQTTCGCGGIAYVGVYNMTSNHQYYQPALVFEKGLGGGTVAKYLAEATSHEVGHNLGLSHDGTPTAGYYTGQGSWAPIMGVGYYKPIVQWSKGEYTGASQLQDDLAVIQSYGVPLRTDDHSDTLAGASALGSGATVSATGRIGTRTDVDWFSFAGGGATTVSLTPAPSSPNLDARIELYDSVGTLVTSADPAAATVNYDVASGLGASISVTLGSPGTYYIKVDGVGYADPLSTGYSDYASLGTYTLSVSTQASSPTLAVATTSLVAGTGGQAYSATLAATGGTGPYSWSLDGSSGPLPAGLSIDPSGVISGTPTASGSYPITVKATDAVSATATKALSIDVADAVAVTTSSLSSGTVSAAYTAGLAATGGSGPLAWSLASGALPSGLTLNASTGSISGTPSASGVSSFVARATDGAGRTATASLSITVYSQVAVTTSSLPSSAPGASYSATTAATGGTGSYTWALVSGALPSGLTLNGGTGAITGTPTAPGTSSFTVSATDTGGRSASRALSITIAAPALAIATTTLPAATIGVPYSATLVATGGTGGYTWSIVSGSLPTGLTLNGTTGVISGTPTRSQSTSVKIRVRDSALTSVTKTLAISSKVAVSVSTTSLPNGTVGVAYLKSLSATGGSGSYTWSVTAGSLPGGLSLSASGSISGAPTLSGASSFTVTATDSQGRTGSKAFSITVN